MLIYVYRKHTKKKMTMSMNFEYLPYSLVSTLFLGVDQKESIDPFIKNIYSIFIARIAEGNEFPFDSRAICSHLHISKRTLYRRLKKRKKTYLQVKDDIRRKYATCLLSSNTYTVDYISQLLCFKSSSAFIQSFKRWYGCTPKKWNIPPLNI